MAELNNKEVKKELNIVIKILRESGKKGLDINNYVYCIGILSGIVSAIEATKE